MKRIILAALLAAFAGIAAAQSSNFNAGATAWTPYDRDSNSASPGE
jgi:hypothetical protein